MKPEIKNSQMTHSTKNITVVIYLIFVEYMKNTDNANIQNMI